MDDYYDDETPSPILGYVWLAIGVVMLIALGVYSFGQSSRSAVQQFNVDSVISATVMLTNDDGGGAGFVIGNNLILTAKHVVQDEHGKFSKGMRITDSHGETYPMSVVWVAKDLDIALVTSDMPLPSDMKPLPLRCTPAKAGDTVELLGHPLLQIKWGLAFGHVSSSRAVQGLIPLDISVLPGDSGGPVLDAQGNVIGVTDAVLAFGNVFSSSPTGYALMVPITSLCKIIPRL